MKALAAVAALLVATCGIAPAVAQDVTSGPALRPGLAVSPTVVPVVLRDCPDCPELVVVREGAFLMGSSTDAYEHDERSGETPPLAVRIRRPFALGRFELQAQEFRRFVAGTGHRPALACATDAAAPPASPAGCLTAADASAYLAWLSVRTGRAYRLPSETEWEYATRGGTAGARFWSSRDSHEGVSISRACDYANVYDVSARRLALPVPHARCTDFYPGLAPAGSFLANAFGLYDTIGNVRERLADCFTRSYKGRPPDERPWRWDGCTYQVVRGGSWRSRPLAARSAARDFVPLDTDPSALQDVGLRVSRDLDPTERAGYAR